MLPFVSQVNNFFSFRESFSRRPSVVFSRREERLCSPSLSKSTTFFRFAKLFVSPWEAVVFSNREERLCSPSLSKSTTFFRFAKLFVSPWSQSFFFNREERLCSPSLQESTVFFVSAKIHFACVSVNRFPFVARSVYAPPRRTSQPVFLLSSKSTSESTVCSCSGSSKYRNTRQESSQHGKF